MNLTKTLTTLLLLSIMVATTKAACCPNCTKSLTADTRKKTGDAAMPVVTVFTTPKTTGFTEAGICG